MDIPGEYQRVISELEQTHVLAMLPISNQMGVIGFDGNEYTIPSLDQVSQLFEGYTELVKTKYGQGFTRLEMTPLAVSINELVKLVQAAIEKHGAANTIFQTRSQISDPFLPVRVNKEKLVWIWAKLEQVLDTPDLVYFPQSYTLTHRGLSKTDIIHARHICAFPGWSIGLVEASRMMPKPGTGIVMGDRKQLEIGASPNEYLQTLRGNPYLGESGRTIEEFLIHFLIQLETLNEVSSDVEDENALWCLGQYHKLPYADTVPTGRWIRSLGRIRLDMHRSNNKQCAQSFGAATTVRLPG